MDNVVLPTRVMGLDLSLTATGMFVGNPADPHGSHMHGEITTPARGKDETDLLWNRRRYQAFCLELFQTIGMYTPEVVVVEVTTHAYPVVRKGDTRVVTTRGMEFRAGLGLGRAMGWIDAVWNEMHERGRHPPPFVTIDAGEVKLRVAGAIHASKAAAREHLEKVFGWNLNGWRESESDALACAVAWVRNAEQAARERTYRAIAAEEDRRLAKLNAPSRSRKKTTV